MDADESLFQMVFVGAGSVCGHPHLYRVGLSLCRHGGRGPKKPKQRAAQINTVYHAPPTSPAQRTVVMPSPDLLYSIIRFDISKGPLHITAPFPKDTYWSLSFYSTNTVNYFTINDRQTKTNPLEIVLAPKGSTAAPPHNALIVESPGTKGVVLARFLVKDTRRLADLVTIQKQMACKVLTP
jgi:uncharacterized membrane protein